MNKLRIVGTAAAIVGAAVSLVLLLTASTRPPPFLLVMFVGWVTLPFVALLIGVVWNRFSDPVRSAFSTTSIVIALASIAVYSYFTISPLATTPARTWLLTPGISLILISIVFFYVKIRSDGRR